MSPFPVDRLDLNKSPFRVRKYPSRFELYEATDETRSQRWYWRLKAPNGKIIAVGGEAFLTRAKCLASVRRVQRYAPQAQIKVLS